MGGRRLGFAHPSKPSLYKREAGIRHLTTVRATARLLRTPLGIAVVATVALATAAFSIIAALVDAALLREPPFHQADRLAVLYVTRLSPTGGLTRQRWSFHRFQLLREATSVAGSIRGEIESHNAGRIEQWRRLAQIE